MDVLAGRAARWERLLHPKDAPADRETEDRGLIRFLLGGEKYTRHPSRRAFSCANPALDSRRRQLDTCGGVGPFFVVVPQGNGHGRNRIQL